MILASSAQKVNFSTLIVTMYHCNNMIFRVLLLVAPGFFLSLTLAGIEGIIAYAYYDTKGCDPLESDQISNPNQVSETYGRRCCYFAFGDLVPSAKTKQTKK